MLVYHGSPNKFTKFDYKRIGNNGTSEGYGFYFTDTKGIAERYAGNGYFYTVELKGKCLSGSKRTMKKSEYVKLIKWLDKENDYLSNFGETEYEGYQNVMNEAIRLGWENAEDDASLIGMIVNTDGGDVEKICQAVYKLLGYGYIKDDSPKWRYDNGNHNVYVALVNEVVRIVECEKVKG